MLDNQVIAMPDSPHPLIAQHLYDERGSHHVQAQESPPPQTFQPAEVEVEETSYEESISADQSAEVEQIRVVEETIADRNFRALRSETQRLKAENARLMQEQQDRTRRTPDAVDDYDEDMREDDIVEGKHLKKMSKKVQELETRLAQSTAEIRLKTMYPDLDEVVTETNLHALKSEYPELFQGIISTPDMYNKAASAYTLIKKLGIIPNKDNERERLIAHKNALKPKSTSSVSPQKGSSPLNQANMYAQGLTKDLQAHLLKEMAEARKLY